jgi:hypothetical protein
LLDRKSAQSSSNTSASNRENAGSAAQQDGTPGEAVTARETLAASMPSMTPVGPSALSRIDIPQQGGPSSYPPMQATSYPQHLVHGPPQTYQSLPAGYTNYAPSVLPDSSLPSRLAASQPLGPGIKRGPPPQSHPGETPPKKKQSKWTTDEDREIIELRGRGMKWEDISKRLPGRSAISCRLRFQNYLERRSEWDEEKKNKLARLYERLVPSSLGIVYATG